MTLNTEHQKIKEFTEQQTPKNKRMTLNTEHWKIKKWHQTLKNKMQTLQTCFQKNITI